MPARAPVRAHCCASLCVTCMHMCVRPRAHILHVSVHLLVCAHPCACVCVCLHVSVCTSLCTCLCVSMCLCACLCAHVCVCLRARPCACVYVCLCVSVCTCLCVSMCLCAHPCAHVCVCPVCVCVHVPVHVSACVCVCLRVSVCGSLSQLQADCCRAQCGLRKGQPFPGQAGACTPGGLSTVLSLHRLNVDLIPTRLTEQCWALLGTGAPPGRHKYPSQVFLWSGGFLWPPALLRRLPKAAQRGLGSVEPAHAVSPLGFSFVLDAVLLLSRKGSRQHPELHFCGACFSSVGVSLGAAEKRSTRGLGGLWGVGAEFSLSSEGQNSRN